MEDYKSFISPKRQSVPTPKDIVDENGTAVFGTFDKEFQKMSFLDIKKPTTLPTSLNKMRYTEWEALELNFDEYIVLTAVCDMGIFGTGLTILYNKNEKKLKAWQDFYLAKSQYKIAKNLLDGSCTAGKGKHVTMHFSNDFGNGKAVIKGCADDNKNGTFNYDVSLERVSLPSVVSIPFGKNRPLYSQKDLFKVNGYIEIDGKRIEANENTTAIIDDHKGYYPYKMHYDWITTMGNMGNDGYKGFFGFNLTRNQTLNHDDYNENLIWLQNSSSLLPPVKFIHNEDNTQWTVKDEHDMVNLTFDIGDIFKMEVHALVIDIRYHILFGSINGYVRDTDGKKYEIDDMIGIAEDKSMRF